MIGAKMTLTHRQIEIATQIDQDVQKVGQNAKSLEAGEEAVIELMPKYMHEFKHMLDTLDSNGLNQVCEEYPGFYIFAQMMERIAAGCREGVFDDILNKGQPR